jgi:manganese transport protein
MRKLLAYFIKIIGPAAVITAGTMGAGSTSSLILAGAWFRYDLLWLAIIILPLFVVSVDSASRLGLVNKDRGMFSMIREFIHPGLAWLIIAIHVPVHIFVGMAHMSIMTSATMALFGYNPIDTTGTFPLVEFALSVSFSFALIWLLTSGGYERMQKVMTACMLLMFICFLIVALRGFQEISAILAGFIPNVPADLPVPGQNFNRDSGLSMLAIIGSVLAPGALFGISYLSADSHTGPLDLRREFRKSVINLGLIYGGYSIFVIVAGGFALYPLANHADIDSVNEASQILLRAFPEGISFLAPIVFSFGMLMAAITTYVVIVEVTSYACLDILRLNWHYAKNNQVFKRTLITIILIPALLSPFWEFPALAKNLLLMGVNTIVIPLAFFVLLFLLNKKAVMGQYKISMIRNIVLITGLLLSIGLSIVNLPGFVRVFTAS